MEETNNTNAPQAIQKQKKETPERGEHNINQWIILSTMLSAIILGLVILTIGVYFLQLYFSKIKGVSLPPIKETACFVALLLGAAGSMIIARISMYIKNSIAQKILSAFLMLVVTTAILIVCYYQSDSTALLNLLCGLTIPSLLVLYGLATIQVSVNIFLCKDTQAIKDTIPTFLTAVALLVAIIELFKVVS